MEDEILNAGNEPINPIKDIRDYHYFGLTLLDYFAAQALTGIIAAVKPPSGNWESCAKHAYKMAREMIKEKLRQENQ